ncbi:MAG: acyltransferase [Lachnospiraceae bacterium]|nr:acyltransferase [Lachnospiraceae bacterium]
MKQRFVNLTMFDLIKGIFIIVVVLRHSIPGNAVETLFVWKVLYSVMMPVFFIISGFWLKKKKVKEGIRTSCRYLLLPYITVMGLINLGAALDLFRVGRLDLWKERYFLPAILVMSGADSPLGAMWFLFSLLWGWILFYCILQIKQEAVRTMLALLLAAAGCAWMNRELPFQIAQGLVAAFYVYCGYVMREKRLLEKKMPWWMVLLFLAAWFPQAMWGTMNLALYSVRLSVFGVIGSLAGSFLVIKLSLYANRIENWITDGLKWLGRNTILILCIHAVEMAVFPWRVLFRIVKFTPAATVLQFISRWIIIGVCFVFIKKLQQQRMKQKLAGCMQK